MKKSVVASLLLLVIVLSFGFVYFRSQAAGPENNYFNTHLRAKFAVLPMLRQILDLHFDGDGKADYLGRGYKKILIEVDVMDYVAGSLQGLQLLTSRIEAATGKPTSYVISDRQILYDRAVSKEDIAGIVKKYRNYGNTADTAALYLLFLSRKEGESNLLGQTFEEYALVLFEDALANFTARSPDLLASYEASTALHEFGHQLGLAHNEEPDCLMNEHIDLGERRLQKPEEVIMDFCEFEKVQLE